MKQLIIALFLGILACCISCASGETEMPASVPKIRAATDSITAQVVSYFKDTVVTIYFNKKDTSITSKELSKIKTLSLLWSNGDSLSFMKVIGFTDPSGTEEENILLSQQRVSGVFSRISSHHAVHPKLVYVDWLGESTDVYDLHFQPTHPQQNCVDIWMQIKLRR